MGRIFFGNNRLIVETVFNPGLELAFGEFTFVHQEMKRVFIMVARFSNRPQLLNEFFRAPEAWLSVWVALTAYTSKSIPSKATSQPASSTARRSSASSMRTGLVLFRWV